MALSSDVQAILVSVHRVQVARLPGKSEPQARPERMGNSREEARVEPTGAAREHPDVRAPRAELVQV